ncbi:putative leucine zipper transcription factor-like protein 1-like 6, partial [Homarus americanus]
VHRMSQKEIRTRSKSSCQLSHLVGTCRELPPAELPTARDLLGYGLFRREMNEEDRRNYPVDHLVNNDIVPGLLAHWRKANALFTEPVINTEVRIKSKMKALWNVALKVSMGNVNLQVKPKFMMKLDKLVDILTCHCVMRSCSELGCNPVCNSEVHIDCRCRKEQKIPVQELAFIRGKREKVGSVGSHQMGLADRPETRKQEARQKRKAEEKRRRKAEESAKKEEELRKESLLEMELEETGDTPEKAEKRTKSS